jgi:hypothetical protein
MKRISKMQKIGAVLGAGLLIAAASGSTFAMHTTDDRGSRSAEVRQEQHGTPQTSPLPTPTAEPQAEIEFTGTVEVMASDMWVVGGRALAVTAATEIKPGLDIGVLAKVHAVTQADGSLWAREIEPAEGDDDHGNNNGNDNDNSNDDHGNGNVNSNDDQGNDNGGNVNTNDDQGNDNGGNVNTNDDQGNDNGGNVNTNDDQGNDNGGNVNSNDDQGGSNSNDDQGSNSNDNHGGHGGRGG